MLIGRKNALSVNLPKLCKFTPLPQFNLLGVDFIKTIVKENKMNTEIENFLQEYSKENGWGEIEKGKLIEHLLKESDVISEEIDGSHRWYDDVVKVVKIKDRYFSFGDYHMTGDGSARDMGLEWDDETITEVEPKEVNVIRYIPKFL